MLGLSPVLNIALWLPLVGAVLIAILPGSARGAARWIAAVVSFVVLLLALQLVVSIGQAPPPPADVTVGAPWSPQFVTNLLWIPQLNVHYAVGLDGLSAPMFVLNALLV